MSKDHYIAQTYLKHFHTPNSENLVNAIRKRDLTWLQGVHTETICQKDNWSNSPYHQDDPRIVEEYLKIFEPEWDTAIKALERGRFDDNTKYIIAGYIVYLRACTPTAVRIGQQGMSEMVKTTYNMLAQRELEKGGSPHVNAIRLIEKHGGVKVAVKEEFAKAMGIKVLSDMALKFYQFPWVVLKNETEIPFLTSDNPVCLDYYGSTGADFFFAVTPRLGILIHPVRDDSEEKGKHLRDASAAVKPEGVDHYNRLVIKSAEDLVIFHCKFYHWIRYAVKKYKNWRVENNCRRVPTGDGFLTINQERAVNVQAGV